MANSSDDLSKQAGTTGTDFGGDPGDQAFLMNRKFGRLAGSPVALVDRDFQRLQRQSPRTMAQNTPTKSVSGIIMSAAKGRKKKF
jgi:hypothetical protein